MDYKNGVVFLDFCPGNWQCKTGFRGKANEFISFFLGLAEGKYTNIGKQKRTDLYESVDQAYIYQTYQYLISSISVRSISSSQD